MRESLMWDLNTEERIRNFTWWWWWWLLFIKDPKEPRRSRQLMILWSTKDCQRIKVNDHWWERRFDISKTDDETRFHGMTAAWYYDGRKMHEPFALEDSSFTVRRSSVDEGELLPESENRYVFSGKPGDYRLDIKRPGFDMKFRMGPWNAFMDRQRYKKARYIGKYGYNGLRIYGQKLSGTIGTADGTETVTGTAYFQKIMVNAPAFPWYWGVFHIEDGSFIDYMLPHVGLATGRKTEAPRSWRDGNGLRLSNRMQFYVAPEDKTYHFRVKRFNKTWTPEGLPVFQVLGRSKDGKAELELTLESYSRAFWRFEQRYLRWFNSTLYYNEYPVEVRKLEFREGGRRISLGDLGYVTGNCEHTWGKLL